MAEVACWSHVRRGFFDDYASRKSPIAKEALDRIGALFDIERSINGQPPDSGLARDHLRLGRLLEAEMNKNLTAKLGRYEGHRMRQLKATRVELVELSCRAPITMHCPRQIETDQSRC